MTERQQRMIEGYLPNPRDPELDAFEYYILDDNNRVQKVYISDIMPGESLYGETTYGVRYSATGNRFQGFPGWGKVRKYQLYDNKQDCKDSTHSCYDGWEELRELQMKEAAQETEE